MSTSFAEIVEEVKTLSSQEKQELHQLIEKYLVEERREEICQNYVEALSELAEGAGRVYKRHRQAEGEFDLRVVFHFVDDHQAYFIDIGTHKELY